MEMTPETRRALQSLKEALHRTPVWQEYHALLEKVMAREENRRLLNQYFLLQQELQSAALSDTAADPECVREFDKLNMLLFDDDEISAFLLSRMKWQQLLSAVLEDLVGEEGGSHA